VHDTKLGVYARNGQAVGFSFLRVLRIMQATIQAAPPSTHGHCCAQYLQKERGNGDTKFWLLDSSKPNRACSAR
jgi:hypothetical protein